MDQTRFCSAIWGGLCSLCFTWDVQSSVRNDLGPGISLGHCSPEWIQHVEKCLL